MFLMIISLAISFLNAFVNQISKFVLQFVKTNPYNSDDIKIEIEDIKNQMSMISMVHEFAKYARFERKLNQLNQQWKHNVNVNLLKQLALKATITYSIQGFIILLSVIVFWCYRWVPVAELPPEWLGPFSSVVSWPTGQPGAVGFPVWFLACNSIAKLVAKPYV